LLNFDLVRKAYSAFSSEGTSSTTDSAATSSVFASSAGASVFSSAFSALAGASVSCLIERPKRCSAGSIEITLNSRASPLVGAIKTITEDGYQKAMERYN
jgi:hypothetical protein